MKIRHLLAAPAALAALLAGCSSPADEASDPTTTEADADADTNTETTAETGEDTTEELTAEPVVVGVLYPDLTVAAQFGFAEPLGDLVGPFEAMAADVNANGGLAGRPVELQMFQFDLLVDGDAVRACLEATQDAEVDVVVGLDGVFGDPVTCVTDQNETLMVALDGMPAEFYDNAEGRLFTLLPSKDEAQRAIAAAFADELAAAPFAVFATIDTGGDYDAVEASLLPELAARGLEPAVTVVLDADGEVAASQIPIEIEQLAAAGVETIISTSGFFATAPFAQALTAAGLDVTWVGSDAGGFASDLYASQMGADQLDGAMAVTVSQLGWSPAGFDEPAAEAACRERVAGLTGTPIEADTLETVGAFRACTAFDLLTAAADNSPDDLAAGFGAIGSIDLPTYGPVTFDGDPTGTSLVRRVTWQADCECWTPEGDFFDPFS